MSLKLMAVDDEPDILKLIKSFVEPLACEILTLVDTQEAAQRIQNEKFDGFLLDVQMPDLDGFELTKRIRASSLNREVPIVMLTGLDDVESMRKGFKSGATCFLSKPVSQERVYRLVKAMRGPMLFQKRRHTRLPFKTAVKCRVGPFFDKAFMSSSLTISEGGMGLSPSGGVEEGSELETVFQFPGMAKPVKARAKVVRREPPDHIGVAFIDLNAPALEAIRRYVEGAVKL